jgi:hypothetical protein
MKMVSLSPEEIAKRSAPGGRLPLKGATNAADRSAAKWVNIGDATPAAVAAKAERVETRAKPALVAKRGSPVFK